MNAETHKQLNSFSAFTAKIALDGFTAHGRKLSAPQYTDLLLDNQDVLLTTYGEALICFSSPHLFKRHTQGIRRITPQLALDLGDDFILPDYLTVLDDAGETYRIETEAATFEQWEVHNRLLKQKADETYAKYQDLERSRLFFLSLVKRNKKATIKDALRIAARPLPAPEPEPA